MKILVTGCDGMLGRTVMERFGSDHQLHGVDLADGDLSDAEVAARLVAAAAPDWVLHCAAWTDVDAAQTQRSEALAANGGGTANLVAPCRDIGCGLTYISTDYVFDGKGNGGRGYDEDDPRDPINHYGFTKAQGEEAVMAGRRPWQIVRTSWLFGDGRTNFVKAIRRRLGEHEHLDVVNDQRGNPTYADDLADVLCTLVTSGSHGIFHATNRGTCTWFDLAREVAVCSGADPARIRPCASSAYPRPAARPPCSILRSRRLEEAGCAARPTWQDAVRRYCARLDAGDVVHA